MAPVAMTALSQKHIPDRGSISKNSLASRIKKESWWLHLSFLILVGGGMMWQPKAIAAPPSTSDLEALSPGEIVLLPDYLPLQVGNKWTYLHKDSRYHSSDRIKVEIVSTTIIQWKSYYVFSTLPFVPGLDQLGTLFVRYDEAARRYVRLTREGEVALFPVGRQSDSKFDRSVDEQEKLVAGRLSYLTCVSCASTGVEIVFDKGVGIGRKSVV
jgi:hypothetical protein